MDFSKTKVVVASDSHSKIDASSTHVTSNGFMRLSPFYYKHMIPGEHIKGNVNVKSFLAGMSLPTFGRARINMRSFFVPFRTVFPKFNEFITDAIATNYLGSSLVPSSPIVTNKILRDFLLTGTTYTDANAVAASAQQIQDGTYDFTDGTNFWVLTAVGRFAYKILRSLGYKVNVDSSSEEITFSALPLLALAKVYLDWYANQAYTNNTVYLNVQQLLEFNDPSSQLVLDSFAMSSIMQLMYYISYDSGNDVYTNAWDNPMSPNNGLTSSFTMKDISAYGTSNFNDSVTMALNNKTPIMSQNSSSSVSLGTQYLHDALKSLTDYVKRNQLSSALAVDRFLARFGINLDSAKVNRSLYINSQSVDIDFGQVMSTADTSNANVGDYAGVGRANGEMNFDYKTDEFGIFICTYTIMPYASLCQGYDRNNRHITKDDFFNPEYDNLGCQVVEKGEVFISHLGTFSAGASYLDAFGFAPRYYEYKQKSDQVTGDIVHKSVYQGGRAWILNRVLGVANFGNSIANLTHSFEFTQGKDRGQYNRIFDYTGDDIDHFFLCFHTAAQSLMPCKSLFDTYDFESEGKEITMNGGSAKVN